MKLKEKLDKVFSIFIRLRDSDTNGYGKCISCGKIQHYTKMHNGHFVNRSHMSTRFHEKNCNMQCVKCNSFDEGNNIGYTDGLIRKYGKDVISELLIVKNQTTKYSDFEYKALISHYEKQVQKLKADKNK